MKQEHRVPERIQNCRMKTERIPNLFRNENKSKKNIFGFIFFLDSSFELTIISKLKSKKENIFFIMAYSPF